MSPDELAGKLRWNSSPETVKANKKLIDEAMAEAKAVVDGIQALRSAAQALCKHPNKQTYYDPRDSGWDCPDCGACR